MYRKYPQFAYTVMMRSALPDFRARYPALTVVIGDYDKVELLEACAAEADIVIRKSLLLTKIFDSQRLNIEYRCRKFRPYASGAGIVERLSAP